MLQHASNAWSWGRYVVVHPAGTRLRRSLSGTEPSRATDLSATIEGLDAGVLPARTTAGRRERYLPVETWSARTATTAPASGDAPLERATLTATRSGR
jgi:hypothetical protein